MKFVYSENCRKYANFALSLANRQDKAAILVRKAFDDPDLRQEFLKEATQVIKSWELVELIGVLCQHGDDVKDIEEKLGCSKYCIVNFLRALNDLADSAWMNLDYDKWLHSDALYGGLNKDKIRDFNMKSDEINMLHMDDFLLTDQEKSFLAAEKNKGSKPYSSIDNITGAYYQYLEDNGASNRTEMLEMANAFAAKLDMIEVAYDQTDMTIRDADPYHQLHRLSNIGFDLILAMCVDASGVWEMADRLMAQLKEYERETAGNGTQPE